MEEEIIAALLEWNPWFEKNEVPQELIGISREYDIVSYLSIPEIKILEGVRRSGKSTLLYKIVQHGVQQGKKVLYVNFDDEALKKYALSDIYHAFLQHSPIDYLLIDEIQHCSEWVPFVRKFYDRRELEQIWITGSNSALIGKEYANLLTGRNIKIPIYPLSFSEYLNFNNIKKTSLPMAKKSEVVIKQLFQNYLTLGAFPAIALRRVFQRELLTNYFEDFLYKDIASRYDVNTTKLKDLAIYLTTNSTKLFSYRNLGNVLGLHPNTVSDYISYMKEIFLFDEVCKFDYSLKSQHNSNKKLYVIDTGLANAVSFRFSADKGRVLENLVYLALKKKNKTAEIYFHRNKKECDFIIKDGITITQAIQVTCSLEDPKTAQREIDGLIDAMQSYKLEKGLILTLSESDTRTIEIDSKIYNIDILPVWKWLLSG